MNKAESFDSAVQTQKEQVTSHKAGNGFKNINRRQHDGLGRRIGRRFFMKSLALGGASLMPIGAALADDNGGQTRLGSITNSDAAILRFLAAAEILETDLWEQYSEFVDVDSPYTDAIEAIDDDMPTYIDQNTNDELSHESFLNAFLVKMHKQPVNLEGF